MTQSFCPIPDNLTSGLVEIAPNIGTIEAKECVCYRPPMQPRYPYTHRAIVIRLNDKSLFVILNSAFDWLAPKPTIVESVMTIVRLLILFLIVLPIHALIVLIADTIAPKLVNWSEHK